VLIFALWYWELDRGGPADRCHAVRMYPDFLFPQMQQPDVAPPDWTPFFADYLHLSFTNAISFAASDVIPLTRRRRPNRRRSAMYLRSGLCSHGPAAEYLAAAGPASQGNQRGGSTCRAG
jgi:hypothetical protein